MRLLLVGAFPYPHHQGSQIYFQEQAIALRRAGAEVDLLTYPANRSGSSAGSSTPGSSVRTDPDRFRGLDGFHRATGPDWSAPKSVRSGPSWGKLRADLGLGMTLNDAIASKKNTESPYTAILTHNVEACSITLLLRQRGRISCPPVIYCAHTLMEQELSTYFKHLPSKRFSEKSDAPSSTAQRVKRIIDAFGQRLDRQLARRADGWIALTQSAARVMRAHSTRPGALIAPPLPDPLTHWDPPVPESVARSHGAYPGGFVLYSGNLDGYQELDVLLAAARARWQGEGGQPVAGNEARLEILIASHDPRVFEMIPEARGVRRCHVASAREMLGLLQAARASIVMRRSEGGYPIKLVNSLSVGTPPITFLDREWGLTDGRDALVADRSRPAESLVAALARLEREPDLGPRLGAGARETYEAEFRPSVAAERTLSLIERVVATTPLRSTAAG